MFSIVMHMLAHWLSIDHGVLEQDIHTTCSYSASFLQRERLNGEQHVWLTAYLVEHP